MNRRVNTVTHKTLALAALLSLSGCAEVMLRAPEVPRPAVVQGGMQRTWSVYTDLDSVRGVAATESQLVVATDNGVLFHPRQGNGAPSRLTVAGGLPSDDVRAVAPMAGGSFAVATARGLVRVQGNTVLALPEPPVLDVRALFGTPSGVLFAGGDGGVARYDGSGWSRVGEPLPVLGFEPGPDSTLWVRTTDGVLVFTSDGQVREHRNGIALPAGYVRDLLPLPEGRAFALLQDQSDSMLAYYDGLRWYAYTVEGFTPRIIGLGLREGEEGQEIVMITPEWRYGIREPRGGAEAELTALGRSEPQRVVTYLAGGEGQQLLPPASEATAVEFRPAAPLASLPPNHPEVTAPAFAISPSTRFAGRAYATFHAAGSTFVALANNGLRELGADRAFSSQNLVPDSDLRMVVGPGQTPWTMNDQGILAEWSDGRFVRVTTPEGWRCDSVAANVRGIYIACVSLTEGDLGHVRVYRREGELWAMAAERTMILPVVGESAGAVVAVPYLGVTDNEHIYVALKASPYLPPPEPEPAPEPEPTTRRRRRSEPEPPPPPPAPERLDTSVVVWRGIAQFVAGPGDAVTYHHSRSVREIDGEDSQIMPDRINAIDVSLAGTDEGYAWFATLEGAMRIGNHQGVIFGEARGVPGEVVGDVQVGTQGKVWLTAPEGPGFYFNREMEFRMPAEVRAARPTALAQDGEGRIYAAGPNGLLIWKDDNWTFLTEEQGMPSTSLRDVEVGPDDSVWVLAPGAIYVLDAPAPVTSSGQ